MSVVPSLLLKAGFQELVEAFSLSFGVKITLFSASMEEISSSCPQSGFCTVVRDHLGLLPLCKDMDRTMCSRAAGTDRVTHYRCHAGLHEAILPVKIDGRILGYFMLGQYRDNQPLGDAIRRKADREGYDIHRLVEAWEALPAMESEASDRMLSLFSMMVRFFVSQHYVYEEKDSLVSRVEAWIQDHLGDHLNLEAMASDIGKSVSAISHGIKEKTGLSPGQLMALRRVEAFEAWMASHPGAAIKEGAVQAGFPDQLHFSRVYRRVRGQSPRDFLNAIRMA